MINPEQPSYPPGGLPPPVDYPEYPPAPSVGGYGRSGRTQPPGPPETNSLATASLVTSVLGLPFGVPLTLLCSIGAVIPVIGIVLGIAALTQIRQTGQGGRELAIGGIAVGSVVLALLVVLLFAFSALAAG